MNVIMFVSGKVFIDGTEMKGITLMDIKKTASNSTELTIKLNAKVKGLDITD